MILAFRLRCLSDGNTAIVGAREDDSSQGSASIFTRSGTTWTQQQTITQTGGAAGNSFGQSVALSSDGNTAIVGAYGGNSAGSASIFTRSGTTWTQQQTITQTGGAVGDWFGWSVALSSDGNTAIVSANGDNSYQGSATIFASQPGVPTSVSAYEWCECAECGVVDCSGVGWWFADYGLYRHCESWWRVVFVDEWCSFLHGDGFNEFDELRAYGDGNECGGNVSCVSTIKHDHADCSRDYCSRDYCSRDYCSRDYCSCHTYERQMDQTKHHNPTRRNLHRHNRHHLPDHRNPHKSRKNTTHRHHQRHLQNQEWQNHLRHQAQNQRHLERRDHSEEEWFSG